MGENCFSLFAMDIRFCVVGVCLALSTVTFAQEPLTNTAIEKLASARLGDDVIVSLIQNQPGHYDVTPMLSFT
jgi:hypothetical protein